MCREEKFEGYPELVISAIVGVVMTLLEDSDGGLLKFVVHVKVSMLKVVLLYGYISCYAMYIPFDYSAVPRIHHNTNIVIISRSGSRC